MVDEDRGSPATTPFPVRVAVKKGKTAEAEKRFETTFLVGRGSTCDLRIEDDCISRTHLKVVLDGDQWHVRDLGSTNGTFVNGERITEAVLPDRSRIELGQGGPLLELTIERPAPPMVVEALPGFGSETQIIRHYFEKKDAGEAGEQTLMFRRAFERAHKKKSKKYLYVIGAVLGAAVLVAGITSAVIYHQKQVIARQKAKLEAMRGTAEKIFYAMKALEIQIGQLEDIVLLNADSAQIEDLLEKRRQLGELSRQYDNFVSEIGVYKKAPLEKQVIFRMARTFGECDVNVPEGFVNEVMRYIAMWKTTSRLRTAIERAQTYGYIAMIERALEENNLPRQFLFLALRESEFLPNAVGRATRYGYAKGMWQFIPETAEHYGLKIGPRYEEPVFDPFDERFHAAKATGAAARYLRDINNTEAQASGLLVMASYNWGENNIREILRSMPENPRERNFWSLMKKARIPKETYDYVYSIFSAAVICENPRMFGFDFDPI